MYVCQVRLSFRISILATVATAGCYSDRDIPFNAEIQIFRLKKKCSDFCLMTTLGIGRRDYTTAAMLGLVPSQARTTDWRQGSSQQPGENDRYIYTGIRFRLGVRCVGFFPTRFNVS